MWLLSLSSSPTLLSGQMAQMKPNQKSWNWSAESSLCSAPAKGHPCLGSPWELAPLPHLKHPTASRGLLSASCSQEPCLTPLAQGLTEALLLWCFSHHNPQKPVLCVAYSPRGIGIRSYLTRTPFPQPHCPVLCIAAQGSPSAHQHCSTMPKQLDFHC